MCASTAPLGLYRAMPTLVVVHKCQSWVGLLVASLLWNFPALAPPDTMKARPQGGDVQVSLPQGPLSPVSEVHDVFSNRDSSSTSGEQPRAITIFCKFSKSLEQL